MSHRHNHQHSEGVLHGPFCTNCVLSLESCLLRTKSTSRIPLISSLVHHMEKGTPSTVFSTPVQFLHHA